jgi:perosamine synthetase
VNDLFCACPGLGYSPAAMIAGWLRSYGKPPAWLQVPVRQGVLTYQGRTAIGVLCQLLGLGAGDEVLLPAYNCGAEVDPFVQARCKVTFYQIDRAANADVADIRSRLSKATRLVYVTHFFGWPQDIGGLAELCKQRDMLLVEDCAQALFSGGANSRIGQLGDAVIYSFVKFLALPDGGALVLKPKLSREVKAMRFPQTRCTLRASLPLFKKWLMQSNALWQSHQWGRRFLNRSWLPKPRHRKVNGRREMLPSNRFNVSRRFWRMSRVSLGVLKNTSAQEVVAQRRRNFARLHEQLNNGEHLLPLHHSLPPDVCPMAYPVYAQDPAYARTYLEQKGILIQGWPGYYPGMPWDEFPDACALKDSLLTLPVHQDLSIAQMDYIAKCANSLGN